MGAFSGITFVGALRSHENTHCCAFGELNLIGNAFRLINFLSVLSLREGKLFRACLLCYITLLSIFSAYYLRTQALLLVVNDLVFIERIKMLENYVIYNSEQNFVLLTAEILIDTISFTDCRVV